MLFTEGTWKEVSDSMKRYPRLASVLFHDLIEYGDDRFIAPSFFRLGDDHGFIFRDGENP